MIWILSNIEEEHGPLNTFNAYKKAYKDGEMDIYCAQQNDDFSFINKDDIVIMRTRNENIYHRLLDAQKKIGFKSTLETARTRELTLDKELLKSLLEEIGVMYPHSVKLEDVQEGQVYFVKPLCGEDSIGIDYKSRCTSIAEVQAKFEELQSLGIEPLIEEYIDGEEATTSLIYEKTSKSVSVYSSLVVPNNKLGFHTNDIKKSHDFVPKLYANDLLKEVCLKVFNALGAKHYIRIDSRVVNGVPYVIDVNMIAGLNKKGYMAHCLEVNGIEYFDFIRMIVNTSSN